MHLRVNMDNPVSWSKNYGKLIQKLLSRHEVHVSIRSLKEQFDILQDGTLSERLIYLFETQGFSVNTSRIQKPVSEEYADLYVIDEKDFAVKTSNTSDQAIYLNSDSNTVAADNIVSNDHSMIIGINIQKVVEGSRSAAERLRNLSVLGTLGFGNLGLVAVATALSNILGLATSLFVMVVYDRVLPNQAQESLYALAVGVLLAIVFDILLKMIRSSFLENAANKADHRIVEDIFEQYVESAKDNRTRSIGALSTVVRDFETYRDFISSATILGLIDLPFIFIFIAVIYLIGGPLAIVPLVAVPLLIFGVLFVQPFLVKLSKSLSSATQSRQANLVEILNGLDPIRTNGAYSIMKGRFKKQSENYSDLSNRSKRLSGFTGGLINTVQQMSQVVIIVYGFHLFVAQEITMGAIIATVILSGRSLAPLSKIAQTLSRANSSLSAYKNLKSFLSEVRILRNEDGTNLLSESKTALSINNVTLRLSDGSQPIFENLSLQFTRGEKVAIIGRSGAGKTTLIRMVAGLCQPETGNVRLFENDIRSYERGVLNEKIGFVFQESWLFSGTLRENITLGETQYDDAVILSALEKSGLNFSTEAGETVLDMRIQDRGSNLSGGQKQAVCLARALLRKPYIVAFDEPTSAMDQLTEQNFIQNFKREFPRITAIFVTHKPNLIMMCDRVIVLDHGVIKWDGSQTEYRQLIAKGSVQK